MSHIKTDKPTYLLRSYQDAMATSIIEAFKTPQPFIAVAATAAGKSLIIAEVCHRLNKPVLILQPSREILQQNYAKLLSYGIEDIAMYSASMNSKKIAKYTFATIGSIKNKPELFQQFEYAIIDECFVAGTKVDGISIEDLAPGDTVRSYNHYTKKVEPRKVLRVKKTKAPKKLYCVNVLGESIISTANHPYYVVGEGYIAAKDLTQGDRIVYAKRSLPKKEGGIRATDLHGMSPANSSDNTTPASAVSEEGDRLSPALRGDEKGAVLIGAHVKTEPNDETRNASENGGNPQSNRTQASDTRGEWNGRNSTAGKVVGGVRRKLVYGISGEDLSETTYVPTPLQNRYSKSNTKDSNRGRWEQPLQSEVPGYKETKSTTVVGVDSVEVLERASDGRFPDGNKYDYVYNIEVEENHNYFVEGMLVHNCHQVGPKNINGMYMTFFRKTGITKVCGLTATPFRLENTYASDGNGGTVYTGAIQMLNRITRKPFFRNIVYKVEMQDLIQRGYLTDLQYHLYDVGLEELEMKKSLTSYTEESLEKWSDNKLKHLAYIAKDLDVKHQRVLVFCSSLRQCDRAVQLLRSMNIHSETLDGTTPNKQREDLIDRFQKGALRWVINVGTMTTGFDCPPLDAIVMLRPTMSLPLYIQIAGRAVRIDPNNPNKEAHFYDFTGTAKKFGTAQGVRIVKEDGYKDMIVSSTGQRIDKVALFSFNVKNDRFKKKNYTLDELLAKV